MSPAEKKSAARVFEEHEKEWTPECIESLSVKVGVQLKDMQNLRVCLEAAEVDPSHLDMMAPSSSVATTLTAEAEQAKADMVDANRGLVNFQFIPKNRQGERLLDGSDLLNHCARFVRRRAALGSSYLPSPYLNLEISSFQRKTVLNPTAEDFSAMAIVRDTMGDGAQQKQAKRKLDGVGDVHSSCGFANTPDRIRRLEVCVVQMDY